ncbi:FAD binding domain-containing protein [Terriglobus roseus]|uniref:CO or xanthine dehydrogenase, FAD-binding subunit n=1 Tax=Terriglobus roseus TaxID=392734 RepID=A0A1H4KRR5_9BACT|nr:FAD binding domain-containing protein [Terriglobus roseus]SEB61197.1 CO or xanthine dehydrogenase, FAD-binding subunit [Terriglobus roseus]
MRSNAAEYEIIAPGSLDAVLNALASERLTPIAGGTEVMVALGAGRLAPKRFISLHNISELRFIDDSAPMLRIGAGATFTDIRRSPVIAEQFQLLAQTASWTGSIANQNRGTLGGNIANASPAADTPPALLAYDAELELISIRGTRIMPYSEFHLGYKRTALAPDELIFAVRLPCRYAGHTQWGRKVGTRNAQAISKIALAAVARMENGLFAEIALGAASLRDRPSRLPATEAALLGCDPRDTATVATAKQALATEVAPIDDIRSTARYRSAVAANLLEELLLHCGA